MQITVILPTYNRPASLEQCVQRLCSQSLSPDRFEIVVVDDGSRVPAEDVLADVLEKTDVSLRVIRQANQGPAMARNRGALEAGGRYLAFTDDDCLPDRAWLEDLLVAADQHPGALLSGSVWNGIQNDSLAETSHLILEMVYEHCNRDPRQATFMASSNWCCSREDFLQVGGLDGTFSFPGGEDRDFCDRWIRSGRSIVVLGSAKVEHRHGHTLRSFLAMYYRYGVGARIYHRKKKLRDEAKQRVLFPFYLWMLKQLPGRLCRYPSWWKRCKIAGALCLWQVANACGFLKETISASGNTSGG